MIEVKVRVLQGIHAEGDDERTRKAARRRQSLGEIGQSVFASTRLTSTYMMI